MFSEGISIVALDGRPGSRAGIQVAIALLRSSSSLTWSQLFSSLLGGYEGEKMTWNNKELHSEKLLPENTKRKR